MFAVFFFPKSLNLFLVLLLAFCGKINQITLLTESTDKLTKERTHRSAAETLKPCSGTFSAV